MRVKVFKIFNFIYSKNTTVPDFVFFISLKIMSFGFSQTYGGIFLSFFS